MRSVSMKRNVIIGGMVVLLIFIYALLPKANTKRIELNAIHIVQVKASAQLSDLTENDGRNAKSLIALSNTTDRALLIDFISINGVWTNPSGGMFRLSRCSIPPHSVTLDYCPNQVELSPRRFHVGVYEELKGMDRVVLAAETTMQKLIYRQEPKQSSTSAVVGTNYFGHRTEMDLAGSGE